MVNNSLWRISDRKGEGERLRARTDIAANTLIMQAEIDVVIPEQKCTTAGIADAYGDLSHRKRNRFDKMKLPPNLPLGSVSSHTAIHDRWFHNALCHRDKNGEQFMATFKNLTLIRHSCIPTAILSFNSTIHMMELRAARDIQQDTELMVDRLALDPCFISEDRGAVLLQRLGIECNCDSCTKSKNLLGYRSIETAISEDAEILLDSDATALWQQVNKTTFTSWLGKFSPI